MNELKIEDERFIDLSYELKNELAVYFENNKYFLERRGLSISPNDISIRTGDMNKFCYWVISFLFPEYKIIDTTTKGGGHPDYILVKDDNMIYLELKINEDALRCSQMKWFTQNKDKQGKVLWIYPPSESYSNSKGDLFL